jgi:hypothetical protein
MEPYISIRKESIEKDRIRIDHYISWNKRNGNEGWNINNGSSPLGDFLKNKKEVNTRE